MHSQTLHVQLVLQIIKALFNHILIPINAKGFNRILEIICQQCVKAGIAVPILLDGIIVVLYRLATHRCLFDDEEVLAALGKDMLQKLGYDVVAKTGSLEALDTFLLEPSRYDLVISDMTMPNMTGVELSKEILAGTINAETPLIIDADEGGLKFRND